MNEFTTAKMDDKTKTITIVLILFLTLFPMWSFLFQPPKPLISIFSIILMYGVIFIAYGFIPRRIAVSDSQILIKNIYGSILINLNEIASINMVEKLSLNLRTFGVGGLFGYFGYFNGGDVWYVTNIHKKIKIVLKSGKTYIISPENPDHFIAEIKKRGSALA